MSDLREWLRGIGLEQYAGVLIDNDVDLDVLPELTEEDLEKLGLSLGHRKKLLKAVAALQAPAAAETSPEEQDDTPLTAEFRYLSVMFCDLADSTSLTAKLGAEEMRDINRAYQEACRRTIESYDGYIARYMGDGVMVYFGFPDAQEDAAERAVLAALGIVDAMEYLNDTAAKNAGVELSVRVGVASGRVVVDHIGVGESEESHAVGEAPNLAARLQGLADKNSIVIDSVTQKMAGRAFEYRAHGEHSLKGIAVPVQCWQVTGEREVESRFAASRRTLVGKFVGRQEELGSIEKRWQSACKGIGQLVMISAEPGMGKSRLADEFRKRIEGTSHRLFMCQCSPFHQNTPMFPVMQPLRNWLGFGGEADDAGKLARIAERFANYGAESDEMVALVAELLGVSHAYKLPDLSPGKIKERSLEASTAILLDAAVDAPLLILIEDLQWMDPTTQDWLSILLEGLPTVAAMALCTARPEFVAPSEWHSRNYMPVLLEQLGSSDISAMVSSITGGRELPAEVFDAICDKTEGFPLFVEDLTLMALESDFLEEKQGKFVLKGAFETLVIPDNLQDSLLARLSRLEGARLAGQVGAVIGREFSAELIRAVAPMDAGTLDDALTTLTEAGFLYRRGIRSRATYTFKHALIQDTLYESLLTRERRLFHLRIANQLESQRAAYDVEPELLALHFSSAGEYKKAVEYGIEAGNKSAGEYAYVEAIRSVSRALNSIKKLPEDAERNQLELRLHTIQGPSLLATKGWCAPEIGKSYTRAKELCELEGETETLFKINRGLWGYYAASTQYAKSVDFGQDMLDQAERENSDDKRVEAHTALCESNFWMGRLEQAENHARLGLSLYDRDLQHESHTREYGEDPSSLIYSYSMMANLLMERPEVANTLVETAIGNIDRYTHAFSRGWLLNGIAWYYNHSREPALVKKYGRILYDLAIENDLAPWLCSAKIQCGWANAMTGEVDSGTAMMIDGIESWSTTGGIQPSWMTYSMLIEAYIHAAQYEKALQYNTTAMNNLESTEERLFRSEVFRQRAVILAATGGDPDEIRRLFSESLAVAEEQGATYLVARTQKDVDAFGENRQKIAG